MADELTQLGDSRWFFSRPSLKAGREFQTELDRIINGGRITLSKKSAGACHRAVSLHRDCVLVYLSVAVCISAYLSLKSKTLKTCILAFTKSLTDGMIK